MDKEAVPAISIDFLQNPVKHRVQGTVRENSPIDDINVTKNDNKYLAFLMCFITSVRVGLIYPNFSHFMFVACHPGFLYSL